MKKVFRVFMVSALASAVLFTSCKKEEEEPDPDPTVTCEDLVFPTETGSATINVANFSSNTIQVEAGNILALAVEVTKGDNRPKKLRLFESDCVNELGTEIDLSDQPKGGKNGIDLRNTDDVQLRNVNYTVPTGMNPIYLTIQIDEGGDEISFEQLVLNVDGSGIVDLWSDVILGANSNANASRMASGTGQTYSACNAAENIEYIDITYAVSKTPTDPTPGTCTTQLDYISYICSNPARFDCPIGLPTASADCGEDGSLSTAGGQASYFKASNADFDAADNATLEALTISTSDDQYAQINAVGDVFEFLSPDGRKGLIKVISENADGTFGLDDGRGSISVSVKIQR